MPEFGHDMKPHDTPEGIDRLRAAVDLDMHAHVALGELGHRRLRNGLGRHRILAALDAVDHDHRFAPRRVGPHVAVAADDGALRAGRAARLTDCSDWCRARPLSGDISWLLPSVLPAGGTLTSAITAPRNVRTFTGANREFGKMIAEGGHVTPSIESNPMTACTRIGIHRFYEAAEGSKKDNIYSNL